MYKIKIHSNEENKKLKTICIILKIDVKRKICSIKICPHYGFLCLFRKAKTTFRFQDLTFLRKWPLQMCLICFYNHKKHQRRLELPEKSRSIG